VLIVAQFSLATCSTCHKIRTFIHHTEHPLINESTQPQAEATTASHPPESPEQCKKMKRRPLKGFADDEGSSSSSDENGSTYQIDKLHRQDSNSKNDNEAIEASASTKRHHHTTAARKNKMDALLSELQSAKPTDPSSDRGVDYGRIDDEGYFGRPNKMGSYVEPGQVSLRAVLECACTLCIRQKFANIILFG
jgi:hypothetical protein